MAAKPKRVTYNDPIDDNADYLVPLQYDTNPEISNRTKSTKKPAPPPPTGFLDSIYFLVAILLYAGVPISQFVIGLIYINQCTVRQFISPYMILSGIFGILFVIVGLIVYWQFFQQSLSDDPFSKPKLVKVLTPILIILFLCVIGWFIAGQVIVYEVKLRVELFDPDLPEYCHGNLYKPAWILIFVDYILLLITIILYIMSRMPPPESDTKTKRPSTRNTRK